MDLTIVIPAKNEEKLIIGTLESLKGKIKFPYKVIVVDDYSTDATKKLVKGYMKENRNISYVSTSPGNGGFANALEKGFYQVKSGVVVPVMADLCDDPRTINTMYKKMKGWDVVCGSRYVRGGKKQGGPLIQHYLSMCVCISMKYLIGIPTHDVSNAFKMYKKETLRQVRINPKSGVEASMEILLQMYFNGAKITDVPTRWRGRTAGKSKFKILQRAPRYLKIYLWGIENSLRRTFGFTKKPFYVQ